MKVLVIYRNYIPLYSGYCSFWLSSIPGVTIVIPKPKLFYKRFYSLYRILNKFGLFKYLINLVQMIFVIDSTRITADLYFYTGMIPTKQDKLPYIVDFEHIKALFSFAQITDSDKKKVLNCLANNNCKWILPWSNAAKQSAKLLFGNQYDLFRNKIKVVYPALPLYKDVYKSKVDYSLVDTKSKKRFVFVGKEYKRKGLLEVLEAFMNLSEIFYDIELYVVADVSRSIINQYKSNHIHFHKAVFSQEEIICKFFMTCDMLILPTHEDTFGMVILEALSSGIPVITTKQFATKEIVKNNINGIFVKSKILSLESDLILNVEEFDEAHCVPEDIMIKDIIIKVSILCNNWQQVNEMKLNAVRDFRTGGKFSIQKRNQSLSKLLNSI